MQSFILKNSFGFVDWLLLLKCVYVFTHHHHHHHSFLYYTIQFRRRAVLLLILVSNELLMIQSPLLLLPAYLNNYLPPDGDDYLYVQQHVDDVDQLPPRRDYDASTSFGLETIDSS